MVKCNGLAHQTWRSHLFHSDSDLVTYTKCFPHFHHFVSVFVNIWDPLGTNIVKMIPVTQIAFAFFQTSPHFSSQWSSQT